MFESEFERVEYESAADGFRDWYLVHRVRNARICAVVLHGHGSTGDQPLTRPDIAENWTRFLLKENVSILSPNLRGNAWMKESAVADLRQIIEAEREKNPWQKLLVVSGSMGGTGALIFAMRHPELVNGVGALGAATDPQSYLDWLEPETRPILQEIRAALLAAYPTPELRAKNSVLRHADRLAMPVCYLHGEADATIPVCEARALRDRLAGKPDFFYREIGDGNHDSPLAAFPEVFRKLEELS